MNELNEAEVLLDAANRDLNALLGMLQVEKLFSDEIFGQHVQQAVEKALKAWLVILGETYPRTHNLSTLCHHLEELDCDVSDCWRLTDFTPFSSQFRYEALISDKEPIDRKGTITQVQRLYSTVKTALKAIQSAKETDNQEGSDENC
ncbi:MAG: HEPN domain-containing protein [Phormidesmis sp.]